MSSDANGARRPTRARSRSRTETEFSVTDGPSELRSRLEQAVTTLPQFTIQALEADGAVLTRRVNLLTWGEVITIRWTEQDGSTDVIVQADVRHPTALGDYGQAGRDVDLIVGALLGRSETALPDQR